MEHHGSKKPPEVSWSKYFGTILNKPEFATENEAFDRSDTPFTEILVLLAATLGKHQEQLRVLKIRKEKRLLAFAKASEKEQKRQQKLQEKAAILTSTPARARLEDDAKKRRRQLWHAKRGVEALDEANAKTSKGRKYPGEVFNQPLPVARRTIFLSDQFKVVCFYLEKMREKANGTIAKNTNLEKICRERFPDLVGGNTVYKWVQASQRERWREMPAQLRTKLLIAPNSWRQKVGCPARGRSKGGDVPSCIQRELDHLVMECAQGRSEICERKEVIGPEQIASCQQFRPKFKPLQLPCEPLHVRS